MSSSSAPNYGLVLEGDQLTVTATPRKAFLDPRFLVAALLHHVAKGDGVVCEAETREMIDQVAAYFQLDKSQAEQKFIQALPGMGSVFLLMAILFYIGAVISTKLFSYSFPAWFGDLGLSAYTLFQIMTLESWSMGIVRPVMEVYPYAWLFFVPFIMVTTFAVVNLLVGLIVNSMQDAHHAEDEVKTDAYRDEVLERLEAIERRLIEQSNIKK